MSPAFLFVCWKSIKITKHQWKIHLYFSPFWVKILVSRNITSHVSLELTFICLESGGHTKLGLFMCGITCWTLFHQLYILSPPLSMKSKVCSCIFLWCTFMEHLNTPAWMFCITIKLQWKTLVALWFSWPLWRASNFRWFWILNICLLQNLYFLQNIYAFCFDKFPNKIWKWSSLSVSLTMR